MDPDPRQPSTRNMLEKALQWLEHDEMGRPRTRAEQQAALMLRHLIFPDQSPEELCSAAS